MGEAFGSLRPILEIARSLIGRVVRPGDFVVDATVGRGHDTLWLADRVGRGGLVLGFEIQACALSETRLRLEQQKLLDSVRLVLDGHEKLGDYLQLSEGRPFRGAMFNLGYLPGGDHALVTQPATTVAGLTQAFDALLPGGLITVMCYPGHVGGLEEQEEVIRWARSVDCRRPGSVHPQARSLRLEYLYAKGRGATLVAVEKLEAKPVTA